MLTADPQSDLEGKILMIPVSCPEGTGEYMRSLIIAETINKQYPKVKIEFILNKYAPYATHCPFPAHLLNHSATKEKAAVNKLLDELRPDLVIFDSAGRAAQARKAKKIGANVIFISHYNKKRKKGFSLNRLPALDAHWITQFKFVDGDLTWLERLKLQLFNKQLPLFIGPILTSPLAQLPEAFTDLTPNRFSIWLAGGGGHKVNGQSVTDVFYQAAAAVATPEHPAIVITGANFMGDLKATPAVRVVKLLPNVELMTLLNNATVVVSGGGDTMGQATVLGCNIIAVAMAVDQPSRIQAFTKEGIVRTAKLTINSLTTQFQQALDTPLTPTHYGESGLQLAMKDIVRLLPHSNTVNRNIS